MIEFLKGRKEKGKHEQVCIQLQTELQETARNILDRCYAYPMFNTFTFYLHYDDARLIHGSFSGVRDSKSFMLNSKVWQIIEDWEKKEVWLETI